MKINLTELTPNVFHKAMLSYEENLPDFIVASFSVVLQYQIKHTIAAKPMLNISLKCTVPIFCERTGMHYKQPFDHNFTVVICVNEQEADTMMEQYEPVIAINNELDLAHIVLDEIILSCPRKQELLQEIDA